jgi:hypothetical protein
MIRPPFDLPATGFELAGIVADLEAKCTTAGQRACLSPLRRFAECHDASDPVDPVRCRQVVQQSLRALGRQLVAENAELPAG